MLRNNYEIMFLIIFGIFLRVGLLLRNNGLLYVYSYSYLSTNTTFWLPTGASIQLITKLNVHWSGIFLSLRNFK